MRRGLIAIILCLFLTAPMVARAQDDNWSSADITILRQWVDAAAHDALPVISTASLDAAQAGGDIEQIDEEATKVALKLARMHLLGSASGAERAGWYIEDNDASLPLEQMLEQAVTNDTLETFFALMRPTHSQYSALRAAYQGETDIDRRKAIARNMERWRWMPKSLGDDYVLVNAARFEARLWRDGEQAGSWPIIVGKKSTPTPVFDTRIEGVILNPWWIIPTSIVRESIGALVRRNPSLARQRGYVWSNGRYRQRPGPNNALGQMKLIMPNRFSVYMHDTPSKHLFAEEVRAFSHGCIRTGDAIGYAATLLEEVTTREQIDEIVASNETTTLRLDQSIPVYIAYFTAIENDAGEIEILPDIYNRDDKIQSVGNPAP